MYESWELNHVGLMVTKRNDVLKYFQSLGLGVSVGPQPLLPHEDGEGALTYYRTLEGDPITFTYPTGGVHDFRDGESQIGDCQVEVYPMKPGSGMFISEYLEKKGPGINHICFNTPDIKEDTEILLGKGCDLVFNATVNGETVENYLDTRKFGDVMISLRPPVGEWEKKWKTNNLSHPLVNKWKFLGVGIAVQNLKGASQYYTKLGFHEVGPKVKDDLLKAHSHSFNIGPLIFELIEPVEDDSIFQESLLARGDGIAELVFLVKDLKLEVDKLVEKGVDILITENKESKKFACLDTRKEGNIITRLVQS
jgi:catechol 2,3-dioxygenase-like lactoylglutathione lyase family enzyme